jgi:hypothetical protein
VLLLLLHVLSVVLLSCRSGELTADELKLYVHSCTAVALMSIICFAQQCCCCLPVCLSCRSGELTADELSIALERLGWPDERCSLDKVAELMDK